jgi:hypothetical protein
MYADGVRNSYWIYFIAGAYALSAHLIWTHLIRVLNDKDEIFRYGWYWDVSLYIPIIAVPLIMFAVRPTMLQVIGIVIILIGVVLFHTGAKV